jgi:hypothetical protein
VRRNSTGKPDAKKMKVVSRDSRLSYARWKKKEKGRVENGI